jgi:hypothetical protein
VSLVVVDECIFVEERVDEEDVLTLDVEIELELVAFAFHDGLVTLLEVLVRGLTEGGPGVGEVGRVEFHHARGFGSAFWNDLHMLYGLRFLAFGFWFKKKNLPRFFFLFFIVLRKVILRKDTFLKEEEIETCTTQSASMPTQNEQSAENEACELNKLLMNMPPEEDTVTQLYSGIMRTWVLMQEYMMGDGQDKGLAWCLFGHKEEARQAWLTMAKSWNVCAGECSLVRKYLALEIGHVHKLAALCAVTDGELERAGPGELKTHVVTTRSPHRVHHKTPVPGCAVCAVCGGRGGRRGREEDAALRGLRGGVLRP